jgi:alpha-glucosidase
MEFGIFQPFCRNHSAWDTHAQEPWAFGEPFESHIRDMLKLRRQLQPYLYTLFEEAHRTGAPILRPLLFEYPEDPTTYTTDDEFLLGSALLVAPIARPGTEYRHVYLPAGTWVHYWSGERFTGPTHILAHAPLGQPAIYVRANTPVPMSSDIWLVCVGDAAEGSGELYDDDGEGYAHLDGRFTRARLTCRATETGADLTFESIGGDARWTHTHRELDIHGLDRPTQVTIDGTQADEWEFADGRLSVRLSPSVRRVEIR